MSWLFRHAKDAQPPAEPDGLFLRNEKLVAEILGEYAETAQQRLRDFPAMLTENDKAIYYYAGRHYRFSGAIVDGGCFVGGTTMSLVQGLLDNPWLKKYPDALRKVIRVYDMFEVVDNYILDHLRKDYPERVFDERSFLPVFEENLSGYASFLDVRPGDVTVVGYPDEHDIELFGVDFCKCLPVTDFVVRKFFPRLRPQSLVIQQDFIHQYHPHIHLSMLRLDKWFERYVEFKWGGSVAFHCTKPITEDVIREQFGDDASWYQEVDRNESLLRELESKMFYDENRWVIVLALAFYYRDVGERNKAKTVYREACQRFPQYPMAVETTRVFGPIAA